MHTQAIGILSDRTKRALAQRVALKAAPESPMHDVIAALPYVEAGRLLRQTEPETLTEISTSRPDTCRFDSAVYAADPWLTRHVTAGDILREALTIALPALDWHIEDSALGQAVLDARSLAATEPLYAHNLATLESIQ